MQLTILTLLSLSLHSAPAAALRILQTNDDGWAELNIRTLFTHLAALSHAPLLSAPASNKSGTSSLALPPLPRLTPCQFNSCPAPGPAVGVDPDDPRRQYVNSFPVTSLRVALEEGGLVERLWGEGTGAQLVVSGPNVGSNLDVQVPFSGTVGAAVEGVKQGIPSVAFSGMSGEARGFDSVAEGETPLYTLAYVEGVAEVVAALEAGAGSVEGGALLPEGVWLNVNFPAVEEGRCEDVGEWQYVLTRINPGLVSGRDVETCGNGGRLPTERSVVGRDDGCFVAVSVGEAKDKTTADAGKQADILTRLGNFLSCLPR